MKIQSVAVCERGEKKPIIESNKQWLRIIEDIPKYKIQTGQVQSYDDDGNILKVFQGDLDFYLVIKDTCIVQDHELASMYDSLAKKMINSALWAGTPTPNSQAAKKFANDLSQWISDS